MFLTLCSNTRSSNPCTRPPNWRVPFFASDNRPPISCPSPPLLYYCTVCARAPGYSLAAVARTIKRPWDNRRGYFIDTQYQHSNMPASENNRRWERLKYVGKRAVSNSLAPLRVWSYLKPLLIAMFCAPPPLAVALFLLQFRDKFVLLCMYGKTERILQDSFGGFVPDHLIFFFLFLVFVSSFPLLFVCVSQRLSS